MEFRQLNIFRILAHELNFTKTAKRAHCVQSNVSIQIRTLEQELAVPLFERLDQQVRLTILLTDAGCAYRTKLEHALAQAQVEAETITEFSSVETIKQMRRAWDGHSLSSGLVVEQELAAKKLAVIP